MTRAEFLQKLRETPRDWYLDDGEYIRRSGDGRPMCPLTSLCKQVLPTHEFIEAADELGVDSELAYLIAGSSDNVNGEGVEPGDFDAKLRAQLLDACGLSDVRGGAQ